MLPLVAPQACRVPIEFWGCDPVFKSSVKVLAAHLARLPWAEGDACWLGNHPVRDVDIVGVVIELDPSHSLRDESRVSLTLDDGSGLVECVWWPSGSAEHRASVLGTLKLGCLLHVLGRIGRFRERRQITIHQMWHEIDPAAELHHWLRARELWKTVYSQPFRVPEELMAPRPTGQSRPTGGPSSAATAGPDAQGVVATMQRVLDQARTLCAYDLATDVPAVTAALAKASRTAGAAAQPAAAALTTAQVQRAVDRLVEDSALYVVGDGPRARTFRPT